MLAKRKKYDFYSCTINHGVNLHTIRALKDIPSANVKEGDIGGWIQSESNLDQYDDSWVYKDAEVYGKARVVNNSRIYGVSKVYGNAVINNSSVSGAAVVCDNAVISNSEVCSDAVIKDDAIVTGSTIKDNVTVCCDAVIANCNIDGKVRIDGNTDTSEFKKLNVNFEPSMRQQYTLTEDEQDLVEHIIKPTFFKDAYRFDTKKYHITTKYQDDIELDMWMSRLYLKGDNETNILKEIYMLKLMVTSRVYDLEEINECGIAGSAKFCRSITISVERTTDFNTCKTSYEMKAPLLNAARSSDDDYMDDFRKVLDAYADVFEYRERRKK